MGLHYNDRVDAYQSLMELMAVLKDLAKNPPDLKPTVDEALAATKTAQDSLDALNEKNSEIAKSNFQLSQRKNDLDSQETSLRTLSSDLDTRETTIRKKELDLQARDLNMTAKESDLANRLAIHKKNSDDLAVNQSNLTAFSKSLDDREDAVQKREDKLRDALK